MKKIIAIIVVLFVAIITVAYLYFTGLNSEQKSSQHSLYAATANSSFVFSFENDQSIIDILKGQEILQQIIGADKFSQLEQLKNQFLNLPGINNYFDHQNVYISLNPGSNKDINFLYTTQINQDFDSKKLLETLKANKISVTSTKALFSVKLNDTLTFYAGFEENLVVLSTVPELVINAIKGASNKTNNFADFIKSNSRVTKNSLAELYINFETLPLLLKNTMPGGLTGELFPLDQQSAYAALVYNFSKEKLLLTGVTTLTKPNSYYQLFGNSPPKKVSINNILPDNTANYTAYTLNNYTSFRGNLSEWLKSKGQEKLVSNLTQNIKDKYRIDSEQLFPKYFNDQMITFQMSSTEKLGAINLSNGDKLSQQLIELSTKYDEDISVLNVDDLLYSFFGEAFKKFKRPYYCIIDNYMVFSNNASSLKSFLSKYRSNKLFINTQAYNNTLNQLPETANIHFYLDLENSENIALKNIYLPFFRHIYSVEGLRNYTSISYQLSSDGNKFLSNVLMTKKIEQ
ncbi:MAG: hypothetical protein EOO92_02685 [Pedobacter sp.]|nr:MAG: hypothetical protein EOO92_02685 [Pedobacter sp.]